ncbi:hypothetical protein BGZ94_004592 [Podila epigama]|nr:hypothetical protein BGZ94_004592 [Podila epigama]
MNYNSSAGDSVDVLLPNEMDGIDGIEDIAEDAHHRRSSYSNDVRDDDRASRGDRHDHNGNDDRSRDRHGNNGAVSPVRGADRDDKYDRRPSSQGADRDRRRSRSRSPVRSNSVRDRRVYVGNLSYDVKWTNLKDFMREIGPVAHADVLLTRDGRSKGCGVVEFQNAEDAQTAIRKLNDVVLMGRPVFVREDRESESRIGFSGGRGGGVNPPPPRDHRVGSSSSSRRDVGISSGTRQIYVGNLPYAVTWKDLKDLFRRVGPVDRADVFVGRDNRSKGSGTVSFDSAHDVPRAICT